jgi:hypothetical protein
MFDQTGRGLDLRAAEIESIVPRGVEPGWERAHALRPGAEEHSERECDGPEESK